MTLPKKKALTLNEYQDKAKATTDYPNGTGMTCQLPPGLYPALGLNGEAGEVAEKIKKYWRDNTGYIQTRELIKKELGDTLWYLSEVARQWELSLEEVAEANLFKLADRAARNVIKGSGDER